MRVFLETQRLVLRQFTMADVDNLVSLDDDPEVMRFITGGAATPRGEIADEVLPAFLGYYERFEGYGFWAAVEKATGEFLGWFHFRPKDAASPGEAEAYQEDKSLVRTGNAPRVMASLRSLAISLLRLDGQANIAGANRHHARDPQRTLKLPQA